MDDGDFLSLFTIEVLVLRNAILALPSSQARLLTEKDIRNAAERARYRILSALREANRYSPLLSSPAEKQTETLATPNAPIIVRDLRKSLEQQLTYSELRLFDMLLNGNSTAEIATAIQKTPAYVRNLKHRLLKKIRTIVKPSGLRRGG
ncbi:MAG: RNA polymerase sigma factor [Planctomycetota bacterium]